LRASLDVALYWTSLALSAAAVAIFLWLMREGGEEKGESRKSKDDEKTGAR
jgi:hypothetical protein